MGTRWRNALVFTGILMSLVLETSQNNRNKRQIQPELPRIQTRDGHLVFQTGTNHNISFKSTNGGYININGENVAVMSQLVKSNKQAIAQMQTSPTASSGIASRLTNIENSLNNLQPTGQVQTQLLTLGHRIDLMQATLPDNVNSRLSAVESSLNNLQATGQVQDLIQGLTTRMSRVESRVSRLQTTVQNLQNLLTVDECDSNPCQNGASCVDHYNGYFCQCTAAFQGENCDTDVNECAIYAGTDLGCQNGASCINTVGSFSCQCATNWHGIRCTESHDDCTGASSSELCGHGTCVNVQRTQSGQAKYTCICNDGWTAVGGSDPACTVDVNECTAAGRPVCSVNPQVMCINLPGSFTCGSCPAGYSGNGFSCVDINECALNNGGCSISPMVQCINTPGSRQCGPCPGGFQGTGVTCTWVGMCQDNNGGCFHTASCTESQGFQGRTCTCPPGYVGNGVGAAGCTAQGPVTGACGSTPCMNGAACQNMGSNGYRCVCQTGYSGQNCQTNVNECASNPCQNGGSCSDRVNGFMCQCPETHSGANCELENTQCGAYLTGESGTFRYPATPGAQYPHDVSCAWRVTTTPGKILIATFPTFNLESHPNCAYDHLQVNDGPTAASYAIGRYCGSSTPNNGQPINSTDNQIYFWFKSDVSNSADGFTVQWRSALPVCGGHLEGSDHGEFSSPGYPGNYPHNRDCVWTIGVSPGKKIMFNFATLALEQHPDCNYDYLEIRDGGLDTSPVLRKYCNTTIPPPLMTTGPTARVKFHSDVSQSDQGFHITYAAIAADPGCGGTFTTETGVLISPNYPNPYNHDASCVWLIRVHDNDQVTLTFSNMDLEGHSNCAFDYIEVRDGSDETSPLLGRYCGGSLPVPMTTTGNVIYVKFASDSSESHAGFRATWRVGCGGTFSAPTGVLRSPYYPDPYPNNRMCEYFIMQPQGTRITLTFNAFDVETDSDCSYDYLEIRDGGSSSSPLLGTFCQAVPGPQVSTGNQLYLKFVTDGSTQNGGFVATYAAEENSCGGILTGTTGSITSPGHPNVYPHGANCTWYIHAEPGMVIRLTFHTFVMEYNSRCRYDHVSVYDNSTNVESSLIGKYCGSTIPPVLTSTDNYMTVVLISDASIAHEGFNAAFVALNASLLCGRELRDAMGIITSPNYPGNYPNGRECVWTITAPQGNQILLNITDFALENHMNCNFDYLEIRNGGFATSPLAGKYCGTTFDRVIVSHSNRMYIKLVTDSSVPFRGFSIYYETTATGCGADITSASGSFVSPNYPMPYDHNAECFWTITTARGSRIQLTFVDLDIELGGSRCYNDYVEVRETGRNGNLVGRYCGTSVPDPITSRSNVLWIKYRTDYSVSGRGFHIFFTSLCQNTLTGYSGVIESPNFPNPYPHNRNCTWIINVALGNTVNISFSHFEMEPNGNCQYDYLQIRDGNNENAAELGKYCDANLPPPVATTTDHAWLRFRSDHWVSRNGFRLEYITDGCGGYLTGATGSFTSPNYPRPYTNRRQCEWTIVVATGQAVQLTIGTFDLESHSQCRFDVLEIYGGPDDTAPMLSRLCHTQSSAQVLSSTGNEMFIRFKSDSSVTGSGFSATYETIPEGCGGNFSTYTGSIMSKNYPNDYPHNTDCGWLITVMDQHNIVLTFADFDVENHSNCTYDYVAVYDGPDATSPELLRHCGNSLPSPPVYSSQSNQMYVRMRTDSSYSKKGFKANYVTGCGGTIDAETDGVLISPNYPRNYPMRSNCSWLIQAAHSSDRITLIFTHMDIEEYGECVHDYVIVHDGNDENGPQVGRYCGTTVPSAITSQGSALFVQFVSDYSRQKTGFRAIYSKSISACGGDYTSQSGSFTSPGFPNSYPINTECVWTLHMSPGSKIQLSFSVFNIEDQEFCNNDYVEIHEGQLGGPLVGRFCGNNIPSNLTAYSGLWVKFRSDESSTGQGFVAQYAAVYGGELTGTSGQIGSPNYPNQYPHYGDWAWSITVPTGMRIQIQFTAIDIEADTDGSCVADWVLFKDGGDANSPMLGQKYCGITVPDPFISTTNQLFVEFHTDYAWSGQGFLLNWQATSDHPVSVLPSSSVPGCGGILNVTEEIQTIVSPGYPTGYAPNLACAWNLTVPQGQRLWFNVSYIDLEDHGSCNYDYIKIFDHSRWRRRRSIGTFCGRTPNFRPIIARGQTGSVVFRTDMNTNNTGFIVQYKAVCGGRIYRTHSGVLKSPMYPNNYPVNTTCMWRVRVSRGRTISVTFDQFNIQGTQGSCSGDALQLLNGRRSNSPPLGSSTDGRYCGSNAPAPMETSDNNIIVKFTSDGSGGAPGFLLRYTEVQVACGGHLYLDDSTPTATFTTPNYPNNYQHSLDCVWIITAPASDRVQLEFVETFRIERHSRCRWDFVELRDGGTINAPSLGKFCGYTAPASVVSTGNVLYVRFRSDSSVSRDGFKAKYQIASCGGRLLPTVGAPVTITSTNYPRYYDNNQDCVWTFEGSGGHYLTFNFDDFRLQSSTNCSSDFVEVREINATGPLLLHACGDTVPGPVLTADKFGQVRFRSDGSGQRSGFSLTVSTSREECGGDLNTPTGTFQSPNFPGNYPHSRRCVWKIRVQEGRKVSIRFNTFNIEDHRYCRYDSVQIYNGRYRDSPRLGRYCGDTPPAVIQTTGNTARVTFRTNGQNSNGGFQATYTSDEDADCGGRFVTAPGNITSPGFEDGNYTNNLQCEWTLSNQRYTNSSIVIHFRVLKLERHVSCRYDWLEIREGDSIDGLILEKFCGNNTMPPAIITPLSNVWMRFRTDRSIVDHGFFLQYNYTQCGGILTNPNGVITSPNFPNNYDHNDACAWQINAPEGQRVSLVFDQFHMEYHSNCGFDFLEIFNGPYPSSPSLGKFCGVNKPRPIKSQSSSVRIVFYTDISASALGFSLNYTFESEGCGGTLNSREGNISTPNFPRSYPHNTECVWEIYTDQGYFITFSFNPPFDIETQANCDNDFVEVSNQLENGSLASIGKYCGNTLPPVIRSNGRKLVVRFRTDASTNGNGFSARWESGCGGVITSSQPYGYLTSPGFPRNYANHLKCNYTLQMEPEHYILIRFTDFVLEGDIPCQEIRQEMDLNSSFSSCQEICQAWASLGPRDCRFDFLAFYHGNSSNGTQIGKFCGNVVPQQFSALGSIYIQFVTDHSVQRKGFRLFYRVSECGGVFNNRSWGVIRTPTTPAEYHNNHNCTWSVTVRPGRVIYLKFSQFQVEEHSSCSYDYLNIFDGPNFTSPLIGRYCGMEIPGFILSTNNTMTLNFISDATRTSGGFRGVYVETYGPAHGCGGYLNTTMGSFSSVDADGDGLYENNLECRWLIMGQNNKVIQLSFTGFALEEEQNCRYDYVKIYDGMSTGDPLLGTFCGTDLPPTFTSTSNTLFVVFHSDSSVVLAGFNASYTTQDALCGGTYISTASPQTVTSPGYPAAFRRDVTCRWTVGAPLSTDKVEVNVTAINLQSTTGCAPEYLEFRDYRRGARGRIVHSCGTSPPALFVTFGQIIQINYVGTNSASTGFSLTYKTASCNRTYTDSSGQIYSPGWPGVYPHNANCQIGITGPAGSTVSLYFNSFRIEPHSNCDYDYLEIHNGSDASSPVVRKICGWMLPNPVYATTNSLWMKFVTDRSQAHPGFDITYTSTTQGVGCGGNITGINGSLTSPGYPGNYTSQSTCTWLITVPARRVMTLTFNDMRMFDTVNCGTDYVVVYDGNSEQSNQFGRYCGGETPAPLTTSSNVGFVKFVSDGVGSALGFRITFTS